MPATTQVCACQNCQCEIQPEDAVHQNNQYFCSSQCAEGHPEQQGCGHGGCACAVAS